MRMRIVLLVFLASFFSVCEVDVLQDVDIWIDHLPEDSCVPPETTYECNYEEDPGTENDCFCHQAAALAVLIPAVIAVSCAVAAWKALLVRTGERGAAPVTSPPGPRQEGLVGPDGSACFRSSLVKLIIPSHSCQLTQNLDLQLMEETLLEAYRKMKKSSKPSTHERKRSEKTTAEPPQISLGTGERGAAPVTSPPGPRQEGLVGPDGSACFRSSLVKLIIPSHSCQLTQNLDLQLIEENLLEAYRKMKASSKASTHERKRSQKTTAGPPQISLGNQESSQPLPYNNVASGAGDFQTSRALDDTEQGQEICHPLTPHHADPLSTPSGERSEEPVRAKPPTTTPTPSDVNVHHKPVPGKDGRKNRWRLASRLRAAFKKIIDFFLCRHFPKE